MIAGLPASARFTTVVGTPSPSSCRRMPSTHGEPSVRTSTRRSILGGSAAAAGTGATSAATVAIRTSSAAVPPCERTRMPNT